MALAPPATSAVVDEQVLEIVARLVDELSAGSARRPTLQDSLDRDLGISSLERVELLLRLEQAFGVRLPDSVMAEASTPQDLVTAILHAAPIAEETKLPVKRVAAPAAHAISVPVSAGSLVDALRWHLERSPDRTHIYLRNDDGTDTPIAYGALAAAATGIGSGLRERGIGKGDRVALMLRTERAFFDTFFAALLIGAVPVPLYPPVRAEDLLAYARRQQRIFRNAEARVLVTFGEAERLAGLIRGQVPSLESVATADHSRLKRRGSAIAWQGPTTSSDSSAMATGW